MGTSIGWDTIEYCKKIKKCEYYHYPVIEQGSHQCRHPDNMKHTISGAYLIQTNKKPKCCPK